MNDVRARWICPYAYGVFADITQWINLVVCLLNIIYPLFCCVFVGLWMMYGRDKSAPMPTECSLIYYLLHVFWCVCWIFCTPRFAELDIFFFNDCAGEINLPLRFRNVRWYIFCAINKLYGMFAEYYTLQVLRSLNMFFLMMYGRDKSAPTPTVC